MLFKVVSNNAFLVPGGFFLLNKKLEMVVSLTKKSLNHLLETLKPVFHFLAENLVSSEKVTIQHHLTM